MLRLTLSALYAVLCVLLLHWPALGNDPFVAVEAELTAARAFPASSLSPSPSVFSVHTETVEDQVNRIMRNMPPGTGWQWDEATQSYWRYRQNLPTIALPRQQPAPMAHGYPTPAPVGSPFVYDVGGHEFVGAGYYGGGGMSACGPNGCGPSSGRFGRRR